MGNRRHKKTRKSTRRPWYALHNIRPRMRTCINLSANVQRYKCQSNEKQFNKPSHRVVLALVYVLCLPWHMYCACLGICIVVALVYVLCLPWYMYCACLGICIVLALVYVLCLHWYMYCACLGICIVLALVYVL